MNRKFLAIIITLSTVFGFLSYNLIEAGTGDNVEGWAWAENIGWISFNNTTGAGTTNYGVNIDSSTGVLSGYAWSENIGWISFNESALIGCPSSPCQAKLDVSTKQVSGWARVCSIFQAGCDGTLDPNRGAWDGWISLRDTSQPLKYGALIDTSKNPAEFWNLDWSDMNGGWISFNHFNCDSDNNGISDQGNFPQCPTGQSVSDYRVTTNFSFNRPPTAQIACDTSASTCQPGSSGCSAMAGCNFVLQNGSTDPDNNISSSVWKIYKAGIPVQGPFSCSGTCNYTPSLLGPGDYSAELTVTDSFGLTGTATKLFTLKRDALADFVCSTDNLRWKDCSAADFRPLRNSLVHFHDALSDEVLGPALAGRRSVPSDGAVITQRTWKKAGVSFSSANNSNPSVVIESVKVITLEITDSVGRKNSISKTLTPQVSLPEWEEVAPF